MLIFKMVINLLFSFAYMSMSMSMSIKNFIVAKIAKLLLRPRGRSVIKAQCQEKTGEKEMFSDVDGRQTEKKILGYRMAI